MTMSRIAVILTIIAGAAGMAQAAGFDPFKETPSEYNARAQWLRDAKLGALVSWNPSSLTGHEMSWERDIVGREKYDALYKEFKGEKFNANEWVKLFHEAGIRYAQLVAKHHDGFCMFDTKTSDYNVMHSPFGRDWVKEMADACARSDVRFCLYYSVLDWWNPKYSDKAGADLTKYKNEVFKPHMRELLTKYGPSGYVWFDGNWDPSWTHADGREMYAFVRKLQPKTLLGNRIEPKNAWDESGGSTFYDAPDAVGDFQAREGVFGDFYMNKAWDSCYCLSANGGWAWVPPANPKGIDTILRFLIQCVGRDGGMLLGVGPRPDGTIAPGNAAALLEIGDWMKLNGDAIYGTRGGPYLPGNWGVSTRKNNKVFLFLPPFGNDALTLPALPVTVKSARLITSGLVDFTQTKAGLALRVPEQFQRAVATIVELTLDNKVMSIPQIAVTEQSPLSQNKPVTVSDTFGEVKKDVTKEVDANFDRAQKSLAAINDGDFDTLWGAPGAARAGWVQVDLGQVSTVVSVTLDEGPYYQHCKKFEVQAQVDGQWKTLVGGEHIGPRKHLSFEPVKAQLFRLNILEADAPPRLAEFRLYGSPTKRNDP